MGAGQGETQAGVPAGEPSWRRFAVDEDRYRHGDHGWLAELDRLTVHAGDPQQRMVTRAIEETEWLRSDAHRTYELALRRRLVTDARAEVSAALPGSEAAGAETAALVAHWLAHHGPGPETDLADDETFTPLERAGVSVQEDLCLMERDRDGAWRLTAAVLCFPSYWELGAKLGHRQEVMHAPVPHYQTDLAVTVSRFFDRLRPGRIVTRRNWGFAAQPHLFAPRLGEFDIPPDIRPDALWLRSERQTLRALPDSGAVLFTIKVDVAPAPALAHHRDVAGRLADAIEQWSPELQASRGARYGGVATIATWLRAR